MGLRIRMEITVLLHTPGLPTPNPQTIYYDGTIVALCDNSDIKNYHPPPQHTSGLGECKSGSLHP